MTFTDSEAARRLLDWRNREIAALIDAGEIDAANDLAGMAARDFLTRLIEGE